MQGKPVVRFLAICDEKLRVPLGHRWVEAEVSRSKPYIATLWFVCLDCSARFSISINRDLSTIGSVEYFDDSCLAAEARLAEIHNGEPI